MDNGAAAQRFTFTYNEFNVRNVMKVNTITLLRERARDLRANYVRMRRCYMGTLAEPFVFDTREGDGPCEKRAAILNRFIHDHINMIENLRSDINRDLDSKKRWLRANRSGGLVVREIREL